MATAKDLMRTDVVYLRINADYNYVNELLDKYHLQSYPVVEAGLSFSSPPPSLSPLPFPLLPSIICSIGKGRRGKGKDKGEFKKRRKMKKRNKHTQYFHC